MALPRAACGLLVHLARVVQEFHFQILQGTHGDLHRRALAPQDLPHLGQGVTFEKSLHADLGDQVEGVSATPGHQARQHRRTLGLACRTGRTRPDHFHRHKLSMESAHHRPRPALEHGPGGAFGREPIGGNAGRPGGRLELRDGLLAEVLDQYGHVQGAVFF